MEQHATNTGATAYPHAFPWLPQPAPHHPPERPQLIPHTVRTSVTAQPHTSPASCIYRSAAGSHLYHTYAIVMA